jgi:cobalt-zinc-cadmium efflux system membrane fusion protein
MTVSRPRIAAARRAVLAALAASSALACGGGTPAAEAADARATSSVRAPDTVTLAAEAMRLAELAVAPAESLPWRDSWSAPARIVVDPVATQSLGAVAEGRVTRVLVRVGDAVAAGQVLAAVHSHEMMDARSAYAKASAAATEAATSLAIATSGAERAERLHALRALSVADLDRARGELAQAAARRSEARAELDRARAMVDHLVGAGPLPAGTDEHEVLLRSPMSGVVVSLDARPGAVVLVGAPLVTVSRTSALLLTLHLPERALGAATPGAAVSFTSPAYPDERFVARVVLVAPIVDSLTRTVEVQAQVDPAAAARLRAEMYVTAELRGPESARTLAVPAAAVQALDGDTVVIAATTHAAGTTLEAARVRVGRRNAERAEILDGLLPGRRVVVRGAAIAKAELLRRRAGA